MNPSDVLYFYDHKKRGPRKDYDFYKSLIQLYDSNPKKAKEVIHILPKIGYYKDFFYILEISGNESFNSYIYDHIVNLIKQWPDNKNLILAKWLPREKSSFDKKIHCVDKIALRLFPEDKLNVRRCNYRRLISQTAQKLNILETNLCTKTYDKISNLTENNLKTYEKLFLKNKVLQHRLVEILDEKYKNYSINQLANEYEIKTLHVIRRPLLDKYLEIKRIESSYSENCLFILDISGELFNNKVTVLYTLILIYSVNHTQLVINGITPKLISFEKNLSMTQVKELINNNLVTPSKINMKKIKELTHNKYETYNIISSRLQKINTYNMPVNWDIIESSYSKKRKDLEILNNILTSSNQVKKSSNIVWNLTLTLILIFLIIYN